MDQQRKNRADESKKSRAAYVQVRKDFLRNPDLSAEEKLIGCLYATYRDPNWMAWPGLARLMRESGYGRDKVKRSRRKLVEKAYLRLRRAQTDDGRFTGARFEITEKILVRHDQDDMPDFGV